MPYDLEISYNNNKLWAGTFGRGLWNSDLYSTPVGIETQNLNSEVSIFPNPNNGEFTVQVPKNKFYDLSVYNVLGERILEERQIRSSQKTIELNSAQSGVYLVRIVLDNKIISRKIIVTQ